MHLLVSEQYIDSIMHGATIKVLQSILHKCSEEVSNGLEVRLIVKYIAHRAVDCRNRPIYSFKEDKRNLSDP